MGEEVSVISRVVLFILSYIVLAMLIYVLDVTRSKHFPNQYMPYIKLIFQNLVVLVLNICGFKLLFFFHNNTCIVLFPLGPQQVATLVPTPPYLGIAAPTLSPYKVGAA